MKFPQAYRAFQYASYGPVKQVLELQSAVPQPSLGAQQVRIKVHSAALNPADYMLAEVVGLTYLGKTPTAENPFNIGFDAAGEVVEVGSETTRLKVGDEVYAMTPFSGFGTLAEFAVVDEEFVALKPRSLTFDQAAAVPLVALTAYQGIVEHAKLKKGETILILGGSSSVGMFAVQFAHALGARVVTTTSSRNAEFVKSLGADQTVDYTTEKWVDILDEHSVDVIYDCGMEKSAWNDGAQLTLKKETGRFVTIQPMQTPVKEAQFDAHLIGFFQVYPSAELLDVITKHIENGDVVPVVDTVYPFEKALDAFEKLRGGHTRGKLVVHVQQ